MITRLSRLLISAALILAWLAVIWVVIDILFADQDTLVGDSIAIICAVLSPILLLLGWSLYWASERAARRPLARA
ncbi:hypothetical protein [Acidisoma cladoniae]|jgi:uncharacterized membrane protein|uniref:hypothetical protein n=1 Tax=Acidisoma cladoniae TaxID=3040935 RepID=UPI00254CF63A|nr:hypothetical protein [Acidisoma sp. PAMC 29798]